MKLDGIRQKVFLDRYALKDKTGALLEKTPEEMWKRISKAVAKVEKKEKQKIWEQTFYEAMEDFKFVPGGRVLAGAGTGYDVTFYNCYVLPSPKDSRDGILDNLKAMIEIMARGGGVGINISSLRPRGARVKKVNGFSSGPCNWAEMYSLATHDIIQQGGSRRGALMLMLWDWHPDIEEFITVKQDLKRINGANLSVAVSDKFMEAVKKDLDWDLVFPDMDDPNYDEKWDGILDNWKKLGKKVKVYKTVKAKKIWDLICDAAWRSAEPGLVFMERYNKWYNNWYWNTVNCVNPCVTGGTLVDTENGSKKAKELKVGDKILTPKGFKPIKKVYNNGRQKIYEVNFSDGGKLRATADHKLRVVRENGNQEWIKVIDLKKNDRVLKLLFLPSFKERWQSNKKNNNKDQEDKNSYQESSIQLRDIDNHNYNFALLAKNKLTIQQKNATIPPISIASQLIFSTGEISGGNTASAKTTCPMSAVISDNFLSSDAPNRNLPKNESSFFPPISTSIANGELMVSFAKVKKVNDTGTYEEVFDVYEPETLTWVTNGYVSLDCGEEGLPAWGVCNLASLNLSAFVKGYSIDKPGKMDYKSLYKYAKIAARFQDDVVDADKYFFKEIEERQLRGERRIGLGTLGLADALIKMHLRYGSKESLKEIDKIFKIIRDGAYEASVEIAREKGAFPKINIKKHLQGYFIKRLPKKTRDLMKKYGVRNSMILQEAPTGTTSLLAGASSGIEPVYEFEFIRRGKLGEHIMYHPLFEEWKKAHPSTNSTSNVAEAGQAQKKPDYFVSANELTPEDHVKVQATIQQYVDASISKTVNAPKIHTIDDVKKLYMLAYDLGCKGITYMRDGSREGVLARMESSASSDQIKEEEVKQEKPLTVDKPVAPRPMQLEGVTYQIDTPVGKTYITINHNEKKEPFEVFITIGKSGSDVAAMADALGRMISVALRLNGTLSPRERIRQIVSQLAGIGGARTVGFGKEKIRSLPDAIAKVLARHFEFAVNGHVEDKKVLSNGNGHTNETSLNGSGVKNGEIVILQQLAIDGSSTGAVLSADVSTTNLFDLCPECGAGSLAYEEGCQKCYSCGYSAC